MGKRRGRTFPNGMARFRSEVPVWQIKQRRILTFERGCKPGFALTKINHTIREKS
jgi:hypothetical protein